MDRDQFFSEGTAAGLFGGGVLTGLWRLFARAGGTARLEAKIDQLRSEVIAMLALVRVDVADNRRASDAQFGEIRRELENHREDDNRRFAKLGTELGRIEHQNRTPRES